MIQPTHLDSKTLRLDPDDPEAPLYWWSRAEDMKRILDQFDLIEASVPELSGRLDRSRIAVAGHSLGGLTAGMLLGERVTDPTDGSGLPIPQTDRKWIWPIPGSKRVWCLPHLAAVLISARSRLSIIQSCGTSASLR